MRVCSLLFCIVVVSLLKLASLVAAYEPFPAEAFGTVPMGRSPSSYMFYELQGDPKKTAAERAQLPLIVYFCGGPGGPGGFPNYIESVGNHKMIFDPNNRSQYQIIPSPNPWTEFANVIFPDSPLGTGWSNAGTPEDFSTTDEGVASNIILMLRGFLKNHPEFKGSKLVIVGESYSGKIVGYLGNAILASGIDMKLTAVSNNDGWVSGIDCMQTYGSFLKANSLCNQKQAEFFDQLAADAKQQLAAGAGVNATNIWGNQQQYYDMAAGGANVYNIRYFYEYFPENLLGDFMNSQYRAKLPPGLIPANKRFNDQDGQVFPSMSNAFMTSGINQYQKLLESGVKVSIWSGQLDLIVSTLCIRQWMSALPWKNLENFNNAPRNNFVLNKTSELTFNNGWLQEFSNLRFWSLTDAGHCAPVDQPATAAYIAKYIAYDGVDVDKTPFIRAKEQNDELVKKNAVRRRRRGLF